MFQFHIPAWYNMRRDEIHSDIETKCFNFVNCIFSLVYESCVGSYECVKTKFWCDGRDHCENGADETECEDDLSKHFLIFYLFMLQINMKEAQYIQGTK